MITEKLFKDSLNILENYQRWIDKLNKLGIELWQCKELEKLQAQYIKLLNYCCAGQNQFDSVEYYVYDTDFGKKADQYFTTEDNGKEYKWHNADELWEYLKEFYPNIEDTTETKVKDKCYKYNESTGKYDVVDKEQFKDMFSKKFSDIFKAEGK